MTVIFEFLKALPGKLWAYLGVAAGLLAALAYFYVSTKNKGKVEAETKAKVDDLTSKVIAHEKINHEIVEDIRVVNEIESEINALPPSDVAVRAGKWVRDRARD